MRLFRKQKRGVQHRMSTPPPNEQPKFCRVCGALLVEHTFETATRYHEIAGDKYILTEVYRICPTLIQDYSTFQQYTAAAGPVAERHYVLFLRCDILAAPNKEKHTSPYRELVESVQDLLD